jgi:integrase
MAEFIAAVRARKAMAALALELLILSNVRTNAVLQARWPEFDLDKMLWNVPLVNLKDREHRKERFEVPPAPRVIDIVKEMEKAPRLDLRLPWPEERPAAIQHGFSDAPQAHEHHAAGRAARAGRQAKWHDPASGRAINAHGFRATFKTWAEEVVTFPHAVIEHAMGHKVGGKVERAYIRTTLLEMRRKLMDAWAAYCEPPSSVEKVTPLRKIA